MAAILTELAGVDLQELGTRILNIASDVSDRSAEQLLLADFKEFTAEGRRFGIGTIETTNGDEVLARRDEVLAALRKQQERGYTSVILAVIDILHERTTLLVVGHPEALAATFDAPLVDGCAVELPGILSRKKNIVPQLTPLAQRIARHG